MSGRYRIHAVIPKMKTLTIPEKVHYQLKVLASKRNMSMWKLLRIMIEKEEALNVDWEFLQNV